MGTRRQPPEAEIHNSPSSGHSSSSGGGRFFDIMTTIFVIASVFLLSATILIVNNPRVSFNPFPLAELPTHFQSPTPQPSFTPSLTPTHTVTPFPPTLTPTITTTPTVTLTPTPTITNTPVIRDIDLVSSITPIITPDDLPTQNTTLTPVLPTISGGTPSPYPFIAREIRYEANTTDQGCQRLSIAGNVIGMNGEPLTDLLVEIVGDEFEASLFTGSNSLFGLSGFEVPVAFSPQVMNFSVRLTERDIPLSDFISVTTGDTCEENVVVIEFVQVRDY